MSAGNPRPAVQSPAEFECEIFLLPTVTGLSQTDVEMDTATDVALWSVLADAVLSDQAFDESEFERGREARLAEVVDLDAYRKGRNQTRER